jgi:carbon monoxide dehydrogenase subunit G
MGTVRIEERYVVRAPVEAVWGHLIDPRRVVASVPGGELEAVVDERTYDGRVRIAVGPFTLAYSGRVHLDAVDAAARRVRIVGEARESAGPGAARLTLDSWLTALPDGGTEVVAEASVDVSGHMVGLGRGVLEQLGHVLFRELASSVRETVEAEEAARAAGAPPPPPARRAPLRAIPLVLQALRAWAARWRRRPSRRPAGSLEEDAHPEGGRTWPRS